MTGPTTNRRVDRPIRGPREAVRDGVSKGVESSGCEPKPGDLSVGKVKRRESDVEAC